MPHRKITPSKITAEYIEFSVSGVDAEGLSQAEDWIARFISSTGSHFPLEGFRVGNNDVPWLRYFFKTLLSEDQVIYLESQCCRR